MGSAVVDYLRAAGDDPVPFDLVNGDDVEDAVSVGRAASETDVVVHLASVDESSGVDPELSPLAVVGSPEKVLSTTVVGTANVLRAAERAGHQRLVFMSSVDALGIFLGQRPPDYLPIDDAHPTYPVAPYALAKRTAERLCQESTRITGLSTVCLRPPGIWDAGTFSTIRRRWAENPLNDRRPFWEYGAWLAIEDVASLVHAALHHPFNGHAVFNVSADDAALALQTSRQAAASIHPDVPWRGGAEYEARPFRTLLDNSTAKGRLGWHPQVLFRST